MQQTDQKQEAIRIESGDFYSFTKDLEDAIIAGFRISDDNDLIPRQFPLFSATLTKPLDEAVEVKPKGKSK